MCCRFALNNFGQLTEKDKSILSEYPLHQIGTLTAELANYQCTDALKQASPKFIQHQAVCKRKHPAHDEMESESQGDSGELLNPVKRAKFDDEICEEMDAVTNEDLHHTMGDSKVRRFSAGCGFWRCCAATSFLFLSQVVFNNVINRATLLIA